MTHTRPLTVIGLTGLAGAGKDTVADLLRTHCGARTLAFADALRTEVADAFCIEELFLTRRRTKEQPIATLALNNCTDRTRAAGAVLEARGKAAKPTAKPAEPTREDLQADYQQRWRTAAVLATIEGLRNTAEPETLDILPTQVAYRAMLELSREVPDKFLHAIFPNLLRGFGDEDLAHAVQSVAQQDQRRRHMLMMMLVSAVDHEPLFDRPADEALHLEAVAPIAVVDLPAIRAQIQAEMREEVHYRDGPAATPTDKAKPALKGKGKAAAPKTTAAEAQAAFAQAMSSAESINNFEPGQTVRVRINLKTAKGALLNTNGAKATITREVGDRAWMVDVEELPLTGKGLIADYTELEVLE